jgi:pimeloyl-ACP methyl ester carboxylesterase
MASIIPCVRRLRRVQTLTSVPAQDGRTLTVREAGDPAGVPVLVHWGTPGSSLLYEPHIRDAEERGIRMFSYDRPAYGHSTRQKGRLVADCAADVTAVCDALGVERLCVWGVSGGGPHALATAALLPDRVAAAASLASVAPVDAEGLDFLDGMGEQNVVSFKASLAGEESHRAQHETEAAEMIDATAEQLVEVLRTLLGPADRGVLTGELAQFLVDSFQAGAEVDTNGWFDDEEAFVRPWGFDLASIRVPVLILQGEDDRFVAYGHGVWLADHVPGCEAWLTAEDGHLTLIERGVPRVHGWLLERF